MTELRLLGPVELSLAARTVEVGPPQRRTVLAALAVDTGRPVPVDVLIRRVWGTEPPDGARRALHAHVTRLRRLCEQTEMLGTSRLRLLRRSGGYLLEARPDQVDIHRFRQLSGWARESERTDEARAALLREALGLWHGEPLAGLGGQWVAQVREAWRRQHADAAVAWARLESRLSDPVTVIGPLTELLEEYPLVEPLTEALMRALHAAGRSAEALDCYTAVRKRLAEELGTDPGPGLRAVHEAILRGGLAESVARPVSWTAESVARPISRTGEFAAPPGPRPTRSADRPEPRTKEPPPPAAPGTGVTASPGPGAPPWPGIAPGQLPMGVRGFTGRLEELARLTDILGSAEDQPSAVVITAVSGTAGVGKTALAVHWARLAQPSFPDGQLYVNLRGFAPSGSVMDPAEAIRGFLDALGVPPTRIPAGLEAQVGLYRSLLTGRKVLMVLDNARDAEQVRPLLPGAPGCLALITSRRSLTGLAATEGAQLLTVGLLSADEARELLARRLGADRVTADTAAVQEIVRRCAGLPLALAIVAARAAAQSALPLAALAAELRGAEGPLDALDGGDASSEVRAVFSWSYRALGTEAARLFRLLALHPGPDATLPAVAALAGTPAARTRVLLAELVRGHLLTEQPAGRFAFHDLLRAYATELVTGIDDDALRHRAAHRMFDFYLHTAHRADALLTPRPTPDALPGAQPGPTPVELTDHRQAQSWFSAEQQVLLAAVEQASVSGFPGHTWRLASALTTYLDRHGNRRALIAAHTTALDAARREGDVVGQAEAHRGLGLAEDRLERPDEARAHYLRALELFGEVGSDTGQARIHQHLSRMSEAHGRHEEALGHAHESLAHHRAAGDRAGESAALNHIGWILAQLGEHRRALAHCLLALEPARETGDLNGQAHIHDSLGWIRHRLGEHTKAVDHYQQALELFHQTGDRHGEAAGLLCLGDVHDTTGRPYPARVAWAQALAVTAELGLPDADPLRAVLLERLGLLTVGSWGRSPLPDR
ncbi:AfsR/SARP family transcriptional regulator [Streptomyces sp. NRRL B-3229]|uniref:AfsR/SARP family transcriptional regulator n=1 Tax=Streptomyces sp. NRRL B-3229 TaxID=1463836 RepID=UPI000A6534C8|nr:BTAD domain-containing putative transcriptional regulator [Streptomyces sp. NRRL B-3229]